MSTLQRNASAESTSEKNHDLEINNQDEVRNVISHESQVDATQNRALHINEGFSEEEVKAVKRKVDWRLIPILSALYAISLIDRTNLGLAAVAGMNAQLRLTSLQYSQAALAFFPTYIVFEIPSNIGIRKFGAAFWLSTAALLWGVVQIGMGFVKNAEGLIATRAVLGIFEAALFPGAAYLLSCWYCRHEVQTRMSAFYASSIFISGLSGILAYGLAQLSGRGGLLGWSWIFIIEGVITVVIASAGYFLIVDFPDSKRAAKLLTEEQRHIVKTRIQRDRADAVFDPLTLGKVGRYLIDPLYWVFALMFAFTTLVSYALAYFMPLLLRGMGYTAANAQILTFPPYVAAFIWAVGNGILSDKLRIRSAFVVLNGAICVIAAAILGYTNGVGVRYFACFLACMGANSNVPLVIGWMHSSISGQSKRAFGSALVVAGGGIGGIIASVAFKTDEAPRFGTGIKTTIALNAAVVVMAIVTGAMWHVRNKQADAGKIVLQGVKGFRYIL